MVPGADGWLLLESELQLIQLGMFWGEHAPDARPLAPATLADPVPAIVEFAESLSQHGIHLLVAPVPPRPMVYPEALGMEKRDVEWARRTMHRQLRGFLEAVEARGVATVDLVEVLANARRRHGETVFLKGETHWTGVAVVRAATAIADEIRDKGWLQDVQTVEFRTRWIDRCPVGDLNVRLAEVAPELCAPREVMRCRKVTVPGIDRGGALGDRAFDSPVVLVGDSYTSCWSAISASLRHQMSAELGIVVDGIENHAGGINVVRLDLVREAQERPGYLSGKRVVIWCFALRDAARESHGWKRIRLPSPV